jgi:hypothetical protein
MVTETAKEFRIVVATFIFRNKPQGCSHTPSRLDMPASSSEIFPKEVTTLQLFSGVLFAIYIPESVGMAGCDAGSN